MRQIPVIEQPSMRTGLTNCSACTFGGATEGIKQFSIKTSESTKQTIALCRDCSEKIALYLIRAWEEDTIRGLAQEMKQSLPLLDDTEAQELARHAFEHW